MNKSHSELATAIDNLVAELRPVLAWIERHPVLIASIAVLLPSAGIYYYAVREQLPLSLLSTDAVSALPMLLAVTGLRILALSVLFFSPVVLSPNRFSYTPDRGIKLLPEDPASRDRTIFRWSLALIAPGALHFAGIYVASFYDTLSTIALWISTPGCLLIFVIISRWAKPEDRKQKWLSLDTYFLLVTGFLQLLSINTIMQLALGLVVTKSNLEIGASLLGASVALGFLQSVVIRAVDGLSERYGVGTLAVSFASVVIIVGMLFPPTGAFLTAQVVNPPGEKSKGCMMLTLRSRDSASIKLLVGDGTATDQIKVVYSTSSVLLVRMKNDDSGTIYRIPVDQVSEFKQCPREQGAREPSKATIS
ncbi:hypothetical protein A9K58_18120 [Stenotrophomonas maltophilia]|uniref:Transmembrane protein n=1 Tax=Stenotrophomonas maltophilia TaxID=40324 RepID=A0A1A6XN60_STEMA|nr:hypothetical protein [Stenotrophomonas maltophilia]OBU64054.1 hypothetical protein A9K58_18120 [Stenotrophomonas maltophilia]